MANVSFENAIRSYLEDRAKTDSLFAETYKKKGKSIKGCCDYIISQAHKKGNGTVVVDDNTVYGWAVHYYDEDDINVVPVKECVEVAADVCMQDSVNKSMLEGKHKQNKRKACKDERQLSLFGDI